MSKKVKGLEGYDVKSVFSRIQDDLKYAEQQKESVTFLSADKTYSKPNSLSSKVMKANLAFYTGDQWKYAANGDSLDIGKGYIALPIVNFIKTIIDQRVNMFKQRKVSIDVKPVGIDKQDELLAIAARYVLEYWWKQNAVNLTLAQVYKDTLIFGIGLFKLAVVNDDVSIIPISPFNAFFDPYALDIESSRYVHIKYIKPREFVEKLREENGTQIEKKSKKEKVEKTDPNEDVTVIESWYNDSVFGVPLCVTWDDEGIISIKEIKTLVKNHPLPIFAFKYNPNSSEMVGQSLVNMLIDLQILHNKNLGIIIDNMLIANNGRIVTSDKDLQVSNDPREIITISSPEEMITTLNLSTLDPRWFNVLQYTGYNTAQMLSQTYSISAGGTENSTRTATGVVAMQRAGSLGTDSDLIEMQMIMGDIGRMVLEMIKGVYSNETLLDILGKEFTDKRTALGIFDNFLSTKYDIIFDLSDPLPDDKLSRNNFYIGLLLQKVIDVKTYAKLTGNNELLNILNEQEVTQSAGNPLEQLLGQMQGGQAQQGQPAAEQTPVQPVAQEGTQQDVTAQV